ncbi:MAG: DUF2254 domain-containing protein [Arenimonas sp.]|uniref:DUF2254 domain-containing protein n=1 Tax=Arenimonas sp. TaxID=1872635 RepID=UPI0025C4729B|nr:DUF2254 domain-containing protein [Arenimonas sp.]MBW8367616.1 DUF2254 domain-containing protein [Arenimonas sp.]
MEAVFSRDRLRIRLSRLRDRLWIKPLVVCLFSVAGVFAAALADGTGLGDIVPEIDSDSIRTLLGVMASSMLVIATLSVSSMVSAYASASATATPRSFRLVVSDDVSQNALSTFLGAFIYSVVGLTAAMNGYFGRAGLFVLFVLTVTVFAIVILTFLRWVDSIARLGRMGSTIDRVEQAAAAALKRRRQAPTLCAAPVRPDASGRAVFAGQVGYVQSLDLPALQAWAQDAQVRVVVTALPGTFATPGRPLAQVIGGPEDLDFSCVVKAFDVGGDRLFDDDPRFGLIVLGEIAGRALSPAVNDPGTAIDVIGTLVRLFTLWSEPTPVADQAEPKYDRVEVPEISARDLFDDAFTVIARDGAGSVEIGVRLQKALACLAQMGGPEMRDAAEHHSRLALKRAAKALAMEEDLAELQAAALALRTPDPA